MPADATAARRPDDRLIDLLRGATQRLVRAVDGMDDAQWAGPSLLPGWTRSHVVAHLTLNAEALGGCLQALAESRSQPMYADQRSRDADIDELAGASPSDLRSRLLASTTAFSDAVASVPDDAWATPVERVPGGRRFPAGEAGPMRLGELEIHHVDLALDYTVEDWPDDFTLLVLDSMAARGPGDLTVTATDLGRTWVCGTGTGPTVTGTGAALGWWLSGREPQGGPGAGPTSDDGVLPRIEAW